MATRASGAGKRRAMRSETPERKVDSRLVLLAYQNVIAHGERRGGACSLDGLTAEGDPDGYTASLSDGVVTVTALFHNQLAIDAPSGRALGAFVTRVQRVATKRYPD